ncbi:hypothetical protein BGW42_001996 [Actinomortierella wolfii]|nr:hypothetical protein BGW42_001996 [Actinomortierella wolfii]
MFSGGFGQQQSSGFGAAQPSGFGSGTFNQPAFGAASNTGGGFGGFGSTSTSTGFGGAQTGSSGFGSTGGGFGSTGGFGTQAQQPGFGSTGFGAATSQPSTGFGGFGQTSGTSAFGGSTGFGAKPTTGFGSTTTGFGAAPATTGFGGTSTGGFGTTGGMIGGQNSTISGTANPPFSAYTEKDPVSGQTSQYQSITAMPAYRNYSFEELRLQDYQQNRKFAGQGGGFGAPSAFGQQPTQTGFGATQPTTGFGSTTTTGFGGTSTGFGTGGFGTTGTTGFGSTAPSTGGFGQQPQQQTTGFGMGTGTGFGSTGTTGAFGTSTTGATGFGGTTGFGATAAKPAFGGFGATATSQPATGGFGTTGGLGAGGTQTTSLFGSTAPSTGTTSLFGSTPASTTPAFGGFGTSTSTTTPATTTTPFGSTTGGGLFGSTAKPAGTGLFGATATSAPATSAPAFGFGTSTTTGTTGGLFGSTATSTATPFGSTPAAGTSLFGTTTTATSQPATTPFGATTGTSLFGAKPATGGGLFGTTPATSLGGTSAFGTSTTQPTSSLFGTGGGLTSGFGASTTSTSPFGASTNVAPQQPSLVASINQQVYGSNPLFQRDTTTTPSEKPQPAVISRTEPQEKLPAFLPPMRFSPRHTQIRLRPSSSATFASSMSSLGSQDKNKKSLLLLDGINDDPNFTTDAYSSRRSVKTLNLKSRSHETLTGDEKSISAGGDSHRVTFSSSLESDALSSAAKPSSSVSTVSASAPLTSGFSASTATREYRPPITSLTQTTSDLGASASNNKEEGEYWMSPSLLELQKMSREELKAVDNFKVGNQKWGSVSFAAPVDLTGINLNDICGKLVKFSRKSCTVYPDDNAKPPRGQGMNVPAIITLSHCWPLDKATREPIKAPVGSTVYNQHVKRLKNRPETKFVDYEADEGRWVFRVEHFSRYGLDDDDEEEVTPTTTGSRPLPSSLPQDDQTAAPASFTTHRDTPVARQRKNIMQAYLFEDETTTPAIPRAKRSSVWSSTSSSGSEDEQQSALQQQHRTGRFGAETRPSFQQEVDRTATSFQAQHPRKFTRVQYDHSLLSRKGALLADAGLMMGRSFRVGWGPRGTLAINGRIVGFSQVCDGVLETRSTTSTKDNESASTSKITIVKLRTVADKEKREIARHASTLRAQLQYTSIRPCSSEDDGDSGPVAEIEAGVSFTDMLLGITQDGKGNISAEEMYAWVLGQTLFDKQPVPDDFELWSTTAQEEFEKRGRRERFSVWLSSVIRQDTDEILAKLHSTLPAKEAAAASIFPLLVSNRRTEATAAAIRAGNHRLATLISQTTRGSGPLVGVDEQLVLYERTNHKQLDQEYCKVLMLLAGRLESEPSSSIASVLEDLDWRKALGLHLWFNNSTDVQLKEAVEQYILATSSTNQKVAQPLPWYQQRHKRSTWNTQSFGRVYDLLFELIALLVSPSRHLESVLHPLASSPSPLDYRLSWHLYQLLVNSLNVGSLTAPLYGADKLCQDFMFQLETLGMWEWAVFVALHIQDAGLRKSSILALLARNVQPYEDKQLAQVSKIDGGSAAVALSSAVEEDSKDDFIVNELKIPAEWLWEARALRAKYEGRIAQQVYALLRAGEHEQGHKLIMSTLAPLCIVQGDLSTLSRLLDSVDQTKVTDWEHGGGIYKRYLDCCSDSEGSNIVGLVAEYQKQKHQQYGQSSSLRRVSYANDLIRKTDVHRLRQELQALLPRLPSLLSYRGTGQRYADSGDDEDRVMHEVCISEMTSKVTTLLDLLEEEPNDGDLVAGMSDGQRMLALQKLANENFDHVLSAC